MPRRVSLPGADELFRTTGAAVAPVPISRPATGNRAADDRAVDNRGLARRIERAPERPPDRTAQRPPAPTPRVADLGHERLRAVPDVSGEPAPTALREFAKARTVSRPRRGSGRTRHEEKITVYVSAQELLDLEHARLVLRAEHGVGVDRGRIVREAIAELLADLDAHGEDSLVVRRLRPQ